MKKAVFIVFLVIICLVLLLLSLSALLFADLDIPAKELLRETSPDGNYEVVVEQMGSPQWPFGPVTARITVRDLQTGKRIDRFKEEVMNDGAPLYPPQFSFVWNVDSVHIAIDPAESALIEHLIPFE